MRKKIFLIFAICMSVISLFAQEVKVGKTTITVDGKTILKYEKINVVEYSFYSLDSDQEILMFKSFNNGTAKYLDDDYFVLNFLSEKVKITSRDFSKIASFFNVKKTIEKLVKWLLKEKVLDENGKVRSEKLDIFSQKYNEVL